MDTLSFSRSFDADVSILMDTSQDFESLQGGVVKWVASQSTNPALQALMKEAERDRKTRPYTPVDEPMPWTSSTSLATSVSSGWRSSGHNPVDPLPLSSSSSSASSSLAPLASRRAKHLPTVQRKPLASSTSSANQPLRDLSRPRSSSHSDPSAPKEKYAPRDDEPEALFFVELLKDASKEVDDNSMMKESVARAKEKKKKREQKSDTDNRSCLPLDTSSSTARPLTKTTSASAVYPVHSSARVKEKALSTSVTAPKPEPRWRASARAEKSSPHVSGKSTPNSLPSPHLNSGLSRLPTRTSNASNTNRPPTSKANLPGSTSNDGDSMMQDVVDLTETDTEWEKPLSKSISRANTAMCMELDDETSGTEMDMSFFKPEPCPQTRIAPPKPKPQPTQSTHTPAPTQRTRSGPPPLGMRRATQLQPSQYSSTQGPKSVTVPRFKPPLLANAGGTTNKNGSGTKKPVTVASSRPPAKVALPAVTQDPDSSFDVSFDVDADALEEAMKAYD